MDSAPREIPGYYYDAEKKKYFKVQANHAAPSGSKYTRDDIKKRKETSLKRKRIEEHSQRISTETIKRSNLLQCPLGGKLLQREYGTLPSSRSFVSEHRAVACARLLSRNRLVDVTSYDARFPVSRFARDPWSGNLLVAINTASNYNLLSYLPKKQSRPWQYRLHQRQCNCAMVGYDWVTSLSIGPTGWLLVSSSNPSGESVHISTSRLTNPLDGRSATQYVVDTTTTFCYPGTMVWCSAPCPSATESIFVVGKSSNLLFITGIDSHWNTQTVRMPNTADIMAVEWLTPRVVMAGMTNSLVQFYDLRSQDTATRLQHPHGVYKIRKVDEWRIVVAGAKKNLHMYDLRYGPSGITTRPQPNKPSHISTEPYLTFHGYENDHLSHDELDISPETGLLACSSPSNKIQLFSLNTGKLIMPPPLIPSLPSSFPSAHIQPQARQRRAAEVSNPNRRDVPITHYLYPDKITCLRFENLTEVPTANGAGNTGKPSLLVSAGPIVEEWRM
ncbi:hypothetical protein BDDG_08834 [Blastomyces dermatitidis ATCC 18188]|uniref:Uncharacterized protein n=1 Tax=Ajellomyces dermatitidis (strain ATCC 18188 / CBS 674.68) TaxID=653446 RepID=F2TRM6_AJEDA|nr:hypothetical protein BDDG_08834 [Blastomyces dermatitidis ATCC 18188]EQL34281.1 hypothetical protein BDFG_03809 [Blastomyces dermatitidis ATCC 26199]